MPCALYEAASPEQRAMLRREVDLADGTWRRPNDATLAERASDGPNAAERVRDALLWHAIEGGAVDFRDDLMSIVVVYHAALRVGVDVEELFRGVAALAPAPIAEHIAGFPRRSPQDRSLAAFGWREVRSPLGVCDTS